MASDRLFPGYVPNPLFTQEDWDEVSDSPELTDEQLAQAVPLSVSMPELVEAVRRERGEPEPTQDFVWLCLDRSLLDAFRNSGAGWQARLNGILRQAVAGGALIRASAEASEGAHHAETPSPPSEGYGDA